MRSDGITRTSGSEAIQTKPPQTRNILGFALLCSQCNLGASTWMRRALIIEAAIIRRAAADRSCVRSRPALRLDFGASCELVGGGQGLIGTSKSCKFGLKWAPPGECRLKDFQSLEREDRYDRCLPSTPLETRCDCFLTVRTATICSVFHNDLGIFVGRSGV